MAIAIEVFRCQAQLDRDRIADMTCRIASGQSDANDIPGAERFGEQVPGPGRSGSCGLGDSVERCPGD